MNASEFGKQFAQAKNAENYPCIEKLLVDERLAAYQYIFALVSEGLKQVSFEKGGKGYLRFAEYIASLYAKQFNTPGLLKQIQQYFEFDAAMCQKREEGEEIADSAWQQFNSGDIGSAIIDLLRSFDLYESIADDYAKSKTANNIGFLYLEMRNINEALSYLHKAVLLADKIDNLDIKANALFNLGNLYSIQGGPAHESLNQALKIYKGLNDVKGQAKVLLSTGNLFQQYGDLTKSLYFLDHAIKLAQSVDALSTLSNAYHNCAGIFERLGEVDKAIKYIQEALKISRELRDRKTEASCLNILGVLHQSSSEYGKALYTYEQSIEISQKNNFEQTLASVSLNRGRLSIVLNQYEEASEYLQLALKFATSRQDISLAATTFSALGGLHAQMETYSLGDLFSDQMLGLQKIPLSVTYYQKALDLYRKAGNLFEQAGILLNVGHIYYQRYLTDQAMSYYRQALELADMMGNASVRVDALLAMGRILIEEKKFDAAIASLKEALNHARHLGYQENIRIGLCLIGRAQHAKGQLIKAAASYDKGVSILETIFDEMKILDPESRSLVMESWNFVYREYLDLLIDLYNSNSNADYDRQIFVMSEKCKSRIFLELMTKTHAQTTFAGDDTFHQMISREEKLRMKIAQLRLQLRNALATQQINGSLEKTKALKVRLKKVEQEKRKLIRQLDHNYPRYADMKRPKPLTVGDTQALLEPDETVVSYAVGKKKIIAFILCPTSFQLIELPIQVSELREHIRQFRKGIDEDIEMFDPAITYSLFEKLFKPLLPYIKDIKEIYLSPDHLLYTLPFEALVDKPVNTEAFIAASLNGQSGSADYLGEFRLLHYLVDSYTFSYIPSVSVLRSLRQYEKHGYGHWRKPLIAFADPVFSNPEIEEARIEKVQQVSEKAMTSETKYKMAVLRSATRTNPLHRLKDSAEEAKAICKAVCGNQKDIYLREKASESNVYEANLGSARYILFSTHGLLGGDFSGVAEPTLVLTLLNNPTNLDGFLTMDKVLNLDLNSEMVTLSACNTYGQGDKAGQGEGFAGLTRSFMYAGARSLCITHWSVESRAACDQMIKTFTFMKKFPPAQALRHAKLAMKDSYRVIDEKSKVKMSLSHPFFWAPFVIVGINDTKSIKNDLITL